MYLGLYFQNKNTYVFATQKSPFAILDEVGGEAHWIQFYSVLASCINCNGNSFELFSEVNNS